MKREEAKKIALEKYKKKYEKAIRKIESKLVKITPETGEVSFKTDHLSIFVVEAIQEYFKNEGWSVCREDSRINVSWIRVGPKDSK